MSIKDVITTEEDTDTDTDKLTDTIVVQSTNLEWFLPDRDE